jgi:predicted DNA-binding transcriptional regulator YafY
MSINTLQVSKYFKNMQPDSLSKPTPLSANRDNRDNFGLGVGGEIVNIISAAAKQSKIVSFNYINEKGDVSARTAEPYRIEDMETFWGFCLLKNEIRRFKVSRMSNVTILNQEYVPRWDVDF